LYELKFTFTFEMKTEDCHNMSQSNMSYFSIFHILCEKKFTKLSTKN